MGGHRVEEIASILPFPAIYGTTASAELLLLNTIWVLKPPLTIYFSP